MHLQRLYFLLVGTLAVAATTPATAQSVAPTVGPAAYGGNQGTASAPDLSGIWVHSLPGFEPLPSGATALVNRTRATRAPNEAVKLVGDYTNPILKPKAAEMSRRNDHVYGESILRTEFAGVCRLSND